jgi:hypothetical protein
MRLNERTSERIKAYLTMAYRKTTAFARTKNDRIKPKRSDVCKQSEAMQMNCTVNDLQSQNEPEYGEAASELPSRRARRNRAFPSKSQNGPNLLTIV